MGVDALRFLVVEDQGFQRWLIEKTLRGLGAAAVLSAADGNAALEVLRSPGPAIDIVVTDLDMPGMDGMEFIRHVAESRSAVSLIVASSLDRALIASVETMAGAYGVPLLGSIQKPVTAPKLAEAIARYSAPRPQAAAAAAAPVAVPITARDIDTALAAGQFEAYFQPKVEVLTRRVVGAEALVRWRHPYRGVLPAQAFIEILEEAGYVGRLTQLMLERAAAASRSWRAAGLPVVTSVNLSMRSASDVTLPDRLTELVASEGLEPRHFVLEVTESAEAPHLGRVLENLARLRMRGFGLSIDDYGMGYSSLQQLSRFPFTELKIDRGFVRNAASRPADRAALESSLEVAAKLGITAVAEGVESQIEWDLLRELGCHQAQGYFIAPAMSREDFTAWARLREPRAAGRP